MVGRTEPARGTRLGIVFDTATGRMLGARETIVDPAVFYGAPTCGPGTPCPGITPARVDVGAGTVLGQSVITTAVVDRAGQRPAR